MFGLFKKQIHEPIQLQRDDFKNYPPEFSEQILNGEDCDELSGGYGEFGSLTNPIPVNGSLGEIKYLGKLRGKSGNALFFHRIGSVNSPVTSHSVDLCEVGCMDGSQWNKLHFSMYHPRRSEKAPAGYSLVPFDKALKMDLPFAYGVNSFVDNFPFSLPQEIVMFYGGSPGLTFARHAQEKINKFDFGGIGERKKQNIAKALKNQGIGGQSVIYSLFTKALKVPPEKVRKIELTYFSLSVPQR